MNKRKKLKNIFSWISFMGGLSSFILLILLIFVSLIIDIEVPIVWHWFPPHSWFFLSVSIIAISSGIYGIWGKGERNIMIRSCIGLILGHLCYVILYPSMIFVVFKP